MNEITLAPIRLVNGIVDLPGSKSITNRALLLAALSEGTTRLDNILICDDTRHMINALKSLGVRVTVSADGKSCSVAGNAGAFDESRSAYLYLGNAGTVMRPLSAVLGYSAGTYTLSGDSAMRRRPIRALVDALHSSGVRVSYAGAFGFPPIEIEGCKGVAAEEVEVDCSLSSQYLSALLLAMPLTSRDQRIRVVSGIASRPYVDLTISLMRAFGVEVEHLGYREFFIRKQNYLSPGSFHVEGDASSASYFLAAAAVKGGTIRVNGVGRDSIQPDLKFAYVLGSMGAQVEAGRHHVVVRRAGDIQPLHLDMNLMPDAAMTAAMTALFAQGSSRISNIYNWRIKETDRLAAMSKELKKLGAGVVEGPDFIEITPPKQWSHARIETYNDHRMAMCFSLAALGPVPVTIVDPSCTYKTYPNYFSQFKTVCDFS